MAIEHGVNAEFAPRCHRIGGRVREPAYASKRSHTDSVESGQSADENIGNAKFQGFVRMLGHERLEGQNRNAGETVFGFRCATSRHEVDDRQPEGDEQEAGGDSSRRPPGRQGWALGRDAVTSRPLVLAILTLTLVGLNGGIDARNRSEPSGDSQSAPDGRTLEDTWRVAITLRNCLTGEPVQNPFPALASFARGGTVTTADGGLSPAVRGTGLGEWWRASNGAFAAVTEAFLFNGGVRTGLQRIRQQIDVEVGGAAFSATVTSESRTSVATW